MHQRQLGRFDELALQMPVALLGQGTALLLSRRLFQRTGQAAELIARWVRFHLPQHIDLPAVKLQQRPKQIAPQQIRQRAGVQLFALFLPWLMAFIPLHAFEQ